MTATQDRSVEFEAAAAERFDFLERRFGFSRTVLRPDRSTVAVRYVNAAIYVNLVYGPPAYEPEMSFGRLGIDNVAGGYNFEAGDLIQLDSCRNWQSGPTSEDRIVSQLAFLARILESCGSECLVGDSAVYWEMKARRDRMIAEWRDQEARDEVTRRIDAAWQVRDYRTIVDLCARYRGPLDALNEKRLRYAKDHV